MSILMQISKINIIGKRMQVYRELMKILNNYMSYLRNLIKS